MLLQINCKLYFDKLIKQIASAVFGVNFFGWWLKLREGERVAGQVMVDTNCSSSSYTMMVTAATVSKLLVPGARSLLFI